MQAPFYPDVFSAAYIDIVVPRADEQAYIHEGYVNELLRGRFLPATRDGLFAIIRDMRMRDGIDAIVLAGTELPLVLTDGIAAGIPLLNTTHIHVNAAVTAAGSERTIA